MADDYIETANAMMKDALLLFEAERYRNACYLAGYVVECTMKALIQKAGGTPKWVHDLNTLYDAIDIHALTATARVAKYGDPTRLGACWALSH